MPAPPVVWSIAGFDPSSGAGISADLKTIAALECYGVACITALTVQNTLGVRLVEAVEPDLVRETLQALFEDLPPASIKIGMLGCSDVADVVVAFLERLGDCPIILDPILRSSSGAELVDQAGVRVIRERLLPLATAITPNRAEAEQLTGLSGIETEKLAEELRSLGARAVVITGGEGEGDVAEDLLSYSLRGRNFVEWLTAPRLDSHYTHGTGCAFSTAIACGLAKGENLPTAVTSAKAFVRRAIQRAPGLGHGRGPMGLEWAGRE